MRTEIDFDIKEIIETESLVIHFQPIISLKLKKAVGVEALCRGIHPDTGEIIPPTLLFQEARAKDQTLMLDRLCRRKAMNDFATFKDSETLVLFLNFDPSVLDMVKGEDKSWTKIFADDAGLNYHNIAVEILESQIENNHKLEQITEKYSKLGMFVVLDDFGALHSNLNRLIISKPDIIKIDRNLVNNVSNSYYQQSIIKSIIDLSKKIGSLTLVEGVETKEDVLKCHELGADLFQGFFFSKPKDTKSITSLCCREMMDSISLEIKDYLASNIEQKRYQHSNFEEIFNNIIANISCAALDDYPEIMDKSIKLYRDIECIYVLDENGVQIGETVCGYEIEFADNSLFHPSKIGTDHSLKEYFYFITSLNLSSYYTDPYISLATGLLCRTMAKKFSCNGKSYILCIDFIDSRVCHII
jgi:EAL domain-containing protein (putative c-di-GMP-specific phosphodiesterase class I)